MRVYGKCKKHPEVERSTPPKSEVRAVLVTVALSEPSDY